MNITAWKFIVRCLAAVLLPATVVPLAAQESGNAAAPGPAVPTWALNCTSPNAATGGLECQMTQRFLRQQSGELVMIVAVTKSTQDASLVMNLVLPHGLHLPSGVTYQIDLGTAVNVPINSSSQNGAVTAIPLPSDLLSALKTGSTMILKMQTMARTELAIPVSLAGFTTAVDRLSGLR